MRKVFVLAIIVSFVLSGCAGTVSEHVKIYKIEKERVDQTVAGNRGYIAGEAATPPVERKAKRTMIGVDIDLPAELFPPFGKDLEEETTSGEEISGTEVPKSGKRTERSGGEEEWIK
jgi:hypothetical protein